MIRCITVSIIVILTAGSWPLIGCAQEPFAIEQLSNAIERELVPPPIHEWIELVTPERREYMPMGTDQELAEFEAERRKYVESIDRTQVEILSVTFVGDYVLAVARVTIEYKNGLGALGSENTEEGTRIFEFLRDGSRWLSASASFSYSARRFADLLDEALARYAMYSPEP